MPKDLTTTSYVLLSLMALRPWSAYELAEQMKRGMAHLWPRAERAIYYEPKNLVEHGLARAEEQMQGQRKRTVYSITPKGRRAVAAWLATKPEPPRIEAAPMLQVGFAQFGSKEDVLSALKVVQDAGEELIDFTVDAARRYLSDGGPFPDRLHLIALWGRFLNRYGHMLRDYARDTTELVATWEDVYPASVWPGWADEMSSWIEGWERARPASEEG